MYPPHLKILPSLTSPLSLGDAVTNLSPSLIEIDGMHHGGCLKITQHFVYLVIPVVDLTLSGTIKHADSNSKQRQAKFVQKIFQSDFFSFGLSTKSFCFVKVRKT